VVMVAILSRRSLKDTPAARRSGRDLPNMLKIRSELRPK